MKLSMNKLDLDYQALLQDILDNGVEKKDRTGVGTRSIFGYTIRHNMREGFPLLTTKKMYWKGIVTELLWFLRGDTNIKYLVDNDCHIWDGDAYKNYWFNWRPMLEDCGKDLTPYTQEEFINRIKTDDEFANKWGELGPIYGKQWRSWEAKLGYMGSARYDQIIDQISTLINDLKTNPDSRRLMVNAWNVGELKDMVLPPCHYGFQVYTRELATKDRLKILIDRCSDIDYKQGLEEAFNDWHNPKWAHGVFETEMDDAEIPTRAISLMWNQRSVDVGLGLPFNVASYALLLEILAKITNMVPDQLIGSLGDTHLYNNHIELVKEQIDREPFELPTLKIEKTNEFWNGFDVSMFTHLDVNDFTVENYQSHPTIKLPLSN